MKSLEIVNERIESTLKAENKLKMELQLCFYKDEANCIKQDLEIIRKKRVDMKLFAMFCVALTNEEILFSYNSNCSYEDEKLTMEELLKLKQ